jgi:hypothetical protein
MAVWYVYLEFTFLIIHGVVVHVSIIYEISDSTAYHVHSVT